MAHLTALAILLCAIKSWAYFLCVEVEAPLEIPQIGL